MLRLQTIEQLARSKNELSKKGIKMRALSPNNVHEPFGRYAHGTEIPRGARLVQTSGQLGIRRDGSIPEDAYTQAVVCFENIARILEDCGMTSQQVAHISAYVTNREYFPAYMRARDEFIGATDRLPSSTLLIVSGFTKPEFKVEVEVLAASK